MYSSLVKNNSQDHLLDTYVLNGNIMKMQLLTYRLTSYSQVLKKSANIEQMQGKVIEVKVGEDQFNDPLSVCNYERRPYRYKLVAMLPMSVAIKFC